MTRLLEGRVALVTGAGHGIGLCVAERFCAEGAAVLLADIDGNAVASAADRLRQEGHHAAAAAVDVSDELSVRACFDAAESSVGTVDTLVANAGVIEFASVDEMSPARWSRVIDVNLTGAFLTVSEGARRMVAAGRPGSVVVTSSVYGRRGGRGNTAYSASKFGLVGLVESAAADLGRHGIRVNALCPGSVATEMMTQVFRTRAAEAGRELADVERDYCAGIPLGRLATTEEVASAFVLVASDLASYVTGQCLVVDGGQSCGG